MALFRVFLSFFLLVPTLPAALGPVGPAEVYQESGGIVVMEAERTPSSLGTGANRWELYNPGETNYVVGATNEGQIEFQGNSSNGGDPKTPLTYKFKINQSGYYHLHLRARARLDGVETDKNNDCYVKVGGASFGAGPNAGNSHLMDAPLALLTTDTKMYGASATTWGWANELDAGGNNNKRFPVYNFSAGSTYTLTISGRSLHYNIDRVVFRQSTIAAASAKSASIPESSTTAGSGATTQSIAALILVNADTDDDIGPITNGAVINLAATGANLNIRAATSPSIIGSVRFSLDGVSDFMTQSSVPYTLGGDLAGDDYLAWTPTLGSHTLTATPYDAAAGGGTAGTPLTLNFTVVNQTATGTPVANAGADQSIRLPTGSVTLNGSGTDSGGSISGHVWTQVSGPGTATLSGAATANLTASALVQGAYIFRLTVTDNSGLTASDDAIVNVAAAAAGSGQSVVTLMLIDADTDGDLGPISNGNTIDLAVTGANLNIRADTAPTTVGSVRFSYDDVPNYMTQSGTPYTIGGDSLTDYLPWTPALGTHTVTATPYTASAGGGIAGTPKTVVFTVINSQLSGNPLVNAGGDKTISLPASSVVFNGTASDGEGPISSYAWSQVSGPGTAVLAGSTTPNLTASSLVHGSYVFRLTVSDNSGLTASDEVTAHVLPATSGDATLSGELKKWHKVTLNFTGPTTSETATPNPFTDYRLNVTFSHPTTGKTFVVPGYFAADGNAANTSATSGAVWRVHFAPDETGAWTYTASFRSGSNIATTTAAGTSAGFFDGDTGNFSIAPTDKTGRDFRGKGRLEYVGKHHLRFAETGEFFMKAGVDAPENLLAYQDFDGGFKTDGQGDTYLKSWSPHAADWRNGDPIWQGTKGKGLIGAINYLAAEGLNAFSFLTMNINGDDKNVFPYTTYGERSRLDVSRMDQWEIVFEHGTRNGMHLNFKTQEIENQNLLDGGDLGNQRILYYRELIARFGHNLGLNWNLGEECTATTARKKAWAQYFHDNDSYKHPIVIHNTTSVLHRELMGDASKLTGFSLQLNASDFTDMFSMTKDYIDRSVAAGKPWVVACDEPGDAQYSLRPDSDPASSHVNARKNALWGNIMAGGAGVEWYFGYQLANSDLTCNDFRSRDSFWDYCRYALRFFEENDIPFERMRNQNSLVSGNGDNANRCLALAGDTYLVQLHSGGSQTLNLSGAVGNFSVKWLNPRTGNSANGPTLAGGGTVNLGTPPDTTTQDWIALVQSSSGGGPTNTAPVVSAGVGRSAVFSGSPVQVTLLGTVTDDGLPNGASLVRSWSQVSGPAAVSFSATNTSSTVATFAATGNYTLRFSVSDSQFSASDEVTVTINPAAGGETATFEPVHDSYTENGANNNIIQLRVENTTARKRVAYLQFDLASLAGVPVESKLRLTEGDDISSGSMTFRLYAAASNWTESGITGANAPVKGVQLATYTGDITDGKVMEFSLGGHITGAGTYSFILEADSSTKDVSFASSENATLGARPALVITRPANSPPVFPGLAIIAAVNQPRVLSHAQILAAASDPDGDPLTVVIESESSSSGATVTMASDRLTYTPVLDYSGEDAVQIIISDGKGGLTSGVIQIQIIVLADGITGKTPPTLQRVNGSQMRVQFTGTPFHPYTIERTTDLRVWIPLHSLTSGAQGAVNWTDLSPPAGEAFYRVTSP